MPSFSFKLQGRERKYINQPKLNLKYAHDNFKKNQSLHTRLSWLKYRKIPSEYPSTEYRENTKYLNCT